ncbi:MAG: hypothetical protein JST16_03465 [Bdellovibrionales bacterium]|nr:hypothetical protein [Bdellovibrionales bacterium]
MKTELRTAEIFSESLEKISKATDRTFAVLFGVQWVTGVLIAFFYTPLTWSGSESSIHPHLYAAVLIGALICSFPLYLIVTHPGATITRLVIAAAQMCYSGLLIHITGGRIETHFHIFGSLAFLSFYRDWRVLIIASLVTAADHFARGALAPLTIYGIHSASPWRAVEHAAWVIFEDTFLIYRLLRSRQELQEICHQRALSEQTIAHVEREVLARTAEVKKSQEVIVQQQISLFNASKLSALGEMAGGIAHEINNPLAIIRAELSFLSDLVQDNEFDREGVSTVTTAIEKNILRIARITEQLRDVARDGSHDAPTQMDIHAIVHEALSLCKEKFRHGGIRFELDRQTDPIFVQVQSTQMIQVVLNLLNNAYDASQQSPHPWIKVSITATPDTAEIEVTDNGPPISKSVREKLFQPFFTTKDIGKGTGLSLSVSRGIVEQHGGRIVYEDEGNSTTFRISLPRQLSKMSAA